MNGERTFALVFDTGDEAVAGLVEFARANELAASHFTAIGGVPRGDAGVL